MKMVFRSPRALVYSIKLPVPEATKSDQPFLLHKLQKKHEKKKARNGNENKMLLEINLAINLRF